MRTDLNVPYAEKDEAKALGAKWDSDGKTWYCDEDGSGLIEFRRWLISENTMDNMDSDARAHLRAIR